jgi:peptide/nickel transport system permease protein
MSQQAGINVAPAQLPGAGMAEAGARAANLAAFDRIRFRKQRSLWNNAWYQFRQHHLAMAGLFVLTFAIVVTVIGTEIYDKDINAYNFSLESATFSREHPLGTDYMGYDILARLLWGGRVSLAVGMLAAFVAISFGTLIGAAAGFFGGFADSLLMRITDMFISLPQVPLLLLITFLFKDSLYNTFDDRFNNGNLGVFVLIVTVISILSWMPTARLVRASFLSLKEKEFVEAARAMGATRHSLMFRHILPNVLSPIIVAATLAVGSSIIFEATLSFLGLGFPSDVPTWGRMLFDAKDRLQFHPHEALVPGMSIFLVVLSINYIGDGLRDALDPRKTH